MSKQHYRRMSLYDAPDGALFYFKNAKQPYIKITDNLRTKKSVVRTVKSGWRGKRYHVIYKHYVWVKVEFSLHN